MNERNTYHAHADSSIWEEFTPIVALDPNRVEMPRLAAINFRTISKNIMRLTEYISLVRHVLIYITQREEKARNKLYEAEIKGHTAEFYKLLKLE